MIQNDVGERFGERVEAQALADGVVVPDALLWSQGHQIAADDYLFDVGSKAVRNC